MAETIVPALCVFCRRHPVHAAWRPFCSERCKLQDLARWADGTYRVAAEPIPDPEEDDNPRVSTLKAPGSDRDPPVES